MWQHYALIAYEQREREAELVARRALLAREAGQLRGHPEPPRPTRARALLAAPVRAFSQATHALSHAACTAATRIEGRTA